MPRGPCVSGVVTSGRTRGVSRPRATSTSPRPASSSTASVFAATCRASTLPATQVTATISASGDAQAYRSARLSSMPVSQSISRGVGAGTGCILEGRTRSRRPYTFDMDVPPILPPATIGILGGGQLGRMLALAARSLGYRIAVLDPNADCPAAGVADRVITAAYDDPGAGLELAAASAVVTYEFEQIDPAVGPGRRGSRSRASRTAASRRRP